MQSYYKAKYDVWLLLIVIGVPVFLVVLALLEFSNGDPVEGAIVLVALAITALLFRFVMPRGYIIREDRIRVVLGSPLGVSIHFDSIQDIEMAPRWATFAYAGVRFSTSIKTPVLIRRSKGFNYVISPNNREAFIAEATKAIADYREENN